MSSVDDAVSTAPVPAAGPAAPQSTQTPPPCSFRPRSDAILMRGESISLARRAAATAKKRREEARAELERQGVQREGMENVLAGLVGRSASTRANVSQNKGKRHKRVKWSNEEVDALQKGVEKYGEGRWAVILREFASQFNPCRISVDLKDKWRNLFKAHKSALQARQPGEQLQSQPEQHDQPLPLQDEPSQMVDVLVTAPPSVAQAGNVGHEAAEEHIHKQEKAKQETGAHRDMQHTTLHEQADEHVPPHEHHDDVHDEHHVHDPTAQRGVAEPHNQRHELVTYVTFEAGEAHVKEHEDDHHHHHHHHHHHEQAEQLQYAEHADHQHEQVHHHHEVPYGEQGIDAEDGHVEHVHHIEHIEQGNHAHDDVHHEGHLSPGEHEHDHHVAQEEHMHDEHVPHEHVHDTEQHQVEHHQRLDHEHDIADPEQIDDTRHIGQSGQLEDMQRVGHPQVGEHGQHVEHAHSEIGQTVEQQDAYNRQHNHGQLVEHEHEQLSQGVANLDQSQRVEHTRTAVQEQHLVTEQQTDVGQQNAVVRNQHAGRHLPFVRRRRSVRRRGFIHVHAGENDSDVPASDHAEAEHDLQANHETGAEQAHLAFVEGGQHVQREQNAGSQQHSDPEQHVEPEDHSGDGHPGHDPRPSAEHEETKNEQLVPMSGHDRVAHQKILHGQLENGPVGDGEQPDAHGKGQQGELVSLQYRLDNEYCENEQDGIGGQVQREEGVGDPGQEERNKLVQETALQEYPDHSDLVVAAEPTANGELKSVEGDEKAAEAAESARPISNEPKAEHEQLTNQVAENPRSGHGEVSQGVEQNMLSTAEGTADGANGQDVDLALGIGLPHDNPEEDAFGDQEVGRQMRNAHSDNTAEEAGQTLAVAENDAAQHQFDQPEQPLDSVTVDDGKAGCAHDGEGGQEMKHPIEDGVGNDEGSLAVGMQPTQDLQSVGETLTQVDALEGRFRSREGLSCNEDKRGTKRERNATMPNETDENIEAKEVSGSPDFASKKSRTNGDMRSESGGEECDTTAAWHATDSNVDLGKNEISVEGAHVGDVKVVTL